ncbi:MAG: hypothetical protein Q8Q00_03030 [Dehalococcoidia bacterium]|nr:hypothetical protein [Dehalococcoidia bacterium]
MSGVTGSTARRSGTSLGKLLAFAVPLVFAIAIGMSVASGLWSATSQQETTPAPGQLAGYDLDQVMSGEEAIAEISELHGEDIPVAEAWVAHYQGNATVWAARATDTEQAVQLLDRMVRGIQKGTSPFSGLARRQFKGLSVYAVTDGRQTHFFYQQGDRVVWLATPRGAEDAFLSAAVREISRTTE